MAAIKQANPENYKGGSAIDNKKPEFMESIYSCIFADTESVQEVSAKVADFFKIPGENRTRFILQYTGNVHGHNAPAIKPVVIEISIDFHSLIFGSRALN